MEGNKQKKEIGTRIKMRREQLRIEDAATLANLLGVTQQAVSSWETGTYLPKIEHLAKLAEVLDTSIDWIITGRGKSSAIKSEMLAILDYYEIDHPGKKVAKIQKVIIERITNMMRIRGLDLEKKPTALVKFAKIQYATAHRILNRTTNPKIETLLPVAQAFKLPVEYFTHPDNEVAELIRIVSDMSSASRAKVREYAEMIKGYRNGHDEARSLL